MDNITVDAVKSAIESNYKPCSFGLRVLTRDQIKLGLGDVLPASRDYAEDSATDDSLPGTSTIGIDAACGEVWERDAERAIGLVGKYDGEIVALVMGDYAGNGEDQGELLIADARIIALYIK